MTASGRVVTLGETMGLLRAEEIGSLAHIDRLRLGIGGAESNVAIALARLGCEVTWLGRVGTDGLGDRVVRELRAEGVEVAAVRDGDAPTGLMLKERRTAETTRVLYYRSGSAGSRLSASDLPAARIADAAVLHVTGITPALSASASDAVLAAVRVATDAGVPVSFDVNHRSTLWRDRDPLNTYREIAASSSIVFAGLDEARLLVGQDLDAADAARAIAELGPAQVVIKLGALGCVALIDGALHEVPAVAVNAVDTVGAGDAFVAGYLAELVAGLPAAARLATAVTVGAFACLHPGDWEGLPRRDELGLLDSSTDPVIR
ncbi:MAG: sugar kinase [Pseudolysinimonas sp.]